MTYATPVPSDKNACVTILCYFLRHDSCDKLDCRGIYSERVHIVLSLLLSISEYSTLSKWPLQLNSYLQVGRLSGEQVLRADILSLLICLRRDPTNQRYLFIGELTELVSRYIS